MFIDNFFSTYLWLRSNEHKQELSDEMALGDVLREDRIPNRFTTDKGQQFWLKSVESLLTKFYIKHHFPQNTEFKSKYAERVYKTNKTKMYRYFTYKNICRSIDKFQGFANSYDKTLHSTIDIEPINVTPRNEEEIRVSTFLSREKRTGKPLSVVRST